MKFTHQYFKVMYEQQHNKRERRRKDT